MLSVYWLCFLLGGTFVTLATFGGIDGAEFDYEIDTDVELGIPLSLHPHNSIPAAEEKRASKRLITKGGGLRFVFSLLMSLRFWGIGVCFFGLTGLALSWLSPGLGGLVILTIALVIGLFLGIAIASTFLVLYYRQVNSLVQSTDLVGLVGTVEIPFDANTRGKVRVDVRGTTVDFVARTDEKNHGFAVGDRVLIVGSDNNRLWVVSTSTLMDHVSGQDS
ncbi:MAG: YqiJ family protein [Cyanothece sp. SIO2G6]|nr:YqiJ family protein [Cyanothece sp. SIO2G6]